MDNSTELRIYINSHGIMELLNYENAKINFKNIIKKSHFKPEITHLLKYKKLLTKEVQKSREKRKFRAVIIELSKTEHFLKTRICATSI